MLSTYNWSGCPLIQVDPEKMGGHPTVAGIHITPEALVENFNSGYDADGLADMFPCVSPAFIHDVLEYAGKQGYLAPSRSISDNQSPILKNDSGNYPTGPTTFPSFSGDYRIMNLNGSFTLKGIRP